jgi:hypothetical protein
MAMRLVKIRGATMTTLSFFIGKTPEEAKKEIQEK